MSPEQFQGTRYATILHVDKTTMSGGPGYHIVYKFLNDPQTPARDVTLRQEQVCQNPRVGMRVRVQFCLSTVLRIERT